MNKLIVTALAFGLASCSQEVDPTCSSELDQARRSARIHDQDFENAHAFRKVTPTDCEELLGKFSNQYNAIFRACEEVTKRATEKEEAKAGRQRALERAEWCRGADIPRPD